MFQMQNAYILNMATGLRHFRYFIAVVTRAAGQLRIQQSASGESIAMTIPTDKKGFFNKLFGRRAA
jgi:hypothetical protein